MFVQRVDVGTGSLVATVRMEAGEPLRTSSRPDVVSGVMDVLPGLSRHRCDNDARRTFSAEARDTEFPHLLEHVACELMALAGAPRTLRGETSWDFERDGRGVFRVTLAFDDDLTALGALKAAEALLRALLDGTPGPDVAAEVERLRGIREGGAARRPPRP